MRYTDNHPSLLPSLTLVAHFIRNNNSQMARAICALHSHARWAVTGTPIQNRLGDLASLLKFIRAHPYADIKQFDHDISRPWKSGEGEEAIKRLKKIATCFLLRRSKAIIQLPHRTDVECPVDFDSEEKEAYTQIHQQARVRIDEISASIDSDPQSNGFINALQQIEALRLFCSLGLRYNSRQKAKKNSNAQEGDWDQMAQGVFNTKRQIGTITCLQCASILDLTGSMYEDDKQAKQKGRFFKCLKFVCTECTRKSSILAGCGHRPSCPTAPVSADISDFEESDDYDLGGAFQPLQFPSKIKALVSDIQSLPLDTKW